MGSTEAEAMPIASGRLIGKVRGMTIKLLSKLLEDGISSSQSNLSHW